MSNVPTTADSPIKRHRWRIISAALLLATIVWFFSLLPNPLFHQSPSAILLARDGTLLGARIADDGQWRFPELVKTPDKFSQALIAYEDKRFNQHPGVDVLALGRALKLNWKNRKVVSGGSTLTMQLARLIANQDAPRARTLRAKVYELLLALRLELRYSKPQLLALYASHAPFGGNVVGLEAAAWRYFGRSPEQLSWAETATLAVLPNAPALVNPGKNRMRLKTKRDALLKRLQSRGVLSALDVQLALAEPLVGEPHALPNLAPHLLETLRARFPAQQRFVSTLDVSLQAQATRIVNEQAARLAQQGIGNVAALVVDNRNFEVLAYVGNVDTRNAERAPSVDIVQRPRSTGSILKPFLYAAMLDSGQLLPTTLVPDVPTQYRDFSPENFDRQFRGAVPANEALAQSLNIPSVRMLKNYGVEHFYDVLTHLGMHTLTEKPDHYGLSLILGGAEATLWDVIRMHSNLAGLARQQSNEGVRYQALTVLRTPTATTNITLDASQPTRCDLSPGAAWLTLNALLEVTRPADEANWKTFASSRNIAWKTGTSWGQRDAWAVGSTSRYTVGVWAGNANGVGVPGLTGATAAAPILFELHGQLPLADWFALPSRTLRSVTVCRDDGYLSVEGCDTQSVWAPLHSHFDQQSPHHQMVHVDQHGKRVDANCEATDHMQHIAWFVLPPTQEYYYRRVHGEYRQLPAWRRDCRPEQALRGGHAMLDFLYPNASGKIYLPTELNGQPGQVVFEAVHRDPDALLYWHLDDRYLGSTQTLHQMALRIDPGMHLLTIVDAQGNRLARQFEVLSPVRNDRH